MSAMSQLHADLHEHGAQPEPGQGDYPRRYRVRYRAFDGPGGSIGWEQVVFVQAADDSEAPEIARVQIETAYCRVHEITSVSLAPST